MVFPHMVLLPCGPFRHSIQDYSEAPVLIEVLSLTLFPFLCRVFIFAWSKTSRSLIAVNLNVILYKIRHFKTLRLYDQLK